MRLESNNDYSTLAFLPERENAEKVTYEKTEVAFISSLAALHA